MDRLNDLITELTECWIEWVKLNKVAMTHSNDVSIRATAGRECEKIVLRRYQIVQKIDDFFDGVLNGTNKTN